MLIDDYFSSLETIIHRCGHIRAHVIAKDKRSDHAGYFKADLFLSDGSRLHVREFVFAQKEIVKDTYAYHHQDAIGNLLFRYDNTRHFPDLPTFPHHKHTSTEVISAQEPDLQTVLNEILTRF